MAEKYPDGDIIHVKSINSRNHQQMRGDMDKKLEELLNILSNAAFSCGAHDDESPTRYSDLHENEIKARQAIIDYFENNQPTER